MRILFLAVALLTSASCAHMRPTMPTTVLPHHRPKYQLYWNQRFYFSNQSVMAAMKHDHRLAAYYRDVANRYGQCLFWLARRVDCNVP